MGRNRVQDTINRCEAAIIKNLADGTTNQKSIDEMDKTLSMELFEYVNFQQLKSIASTDGFLSLDEAMLIYNLLGNTPEHFNDQPVYVKAALSLWHKELLERY